MKTLAIATVGIGLGLAVPKGMKVYDTAVDAHDKALATYHTALAENQPPERSEGETAVEFLNRALEIYDRRGAVVN